MSFAEEGEIVEESSRFSEIFHVSVPKGSIATLKCNGDISYTRLASPEVYTDFLHNKFPTRSCAPFTTINYTKYPDRIAYFQMLHDLFAEDLWKTLVDANKKGKKSQAYNFGTKYNNTGYEKFKAPYHLNIGKPRCVLFDFLNELKRSDSQSALPNFHGKLLGISVEILSYSRKFTVVFRWD
tara:strand:- start:15 stop:560 length:546 start_codon:yes stop_codon:yes gene_type:complete